MGTTQNLFLRLTQNNGQRLKAIFKKSSWFIDLAILLSFLIIIASFLVFLFHLSPEHIKHVLDEEYIPLTGF